MTRSIDDLGTLRNLSNSHHSTNPFHHGVADVTNAGNEYLPPHLPIKITQKLSPYREPRTQQPSFANMLLAALPLDHLNAMRHAARLPGNLDPQANVVRTHDWNLLRPVAPSRSTVQQGFAQNLPRKAFTPRSERRAR